MNNMEKKSWITRIADDICATIICTIFVCQIGKRKN